MNRIAKTLAVPLLGFALAGLPMIAAAQDHHDDHAQRDRDMRHDDWKKGAHIRHEDWERGRRVDDWRAHHLRRPPRGYEWRDIDNHYVLANTSGVILEVHIH